MHELGYYMSYDELRRFLTSAAIHINSNQQQTPSGALVPKEIIPKSAGGNQVICVADNWDHNERTIDGKRTTHAMRSILVSQSVDSDGHEAIPRIRKCTNRTFNEGSMTSQR